MVKQAFILLLLIYCFPVSSQDKVLFYKKSGSVDTSHTSSIDSITFSDDHSLRIHFWNSTFAHIAISEIDSILMIPDPGTPETDREALIALYTSTAGADWLISTNWCTEKPLDQWYGVYTDIHGRVNNISLCSNQLKGTLPPEIGNLSAIESIALNANDISGPIPEEIGNLSNLKQLHLWRCKLSGPVPPEIGKLTELDWLHLAGNKLTGVIPLQVGKLKKLRFLDLEDNELSGPLPGTLGKLSNLETLSLSTNMLTGPIPVELTELYNLKNLTLAFNKLSGKIPIETGLLENLEHLNLTSNELTGTVPAELGNLKKLKVLTLNNNSLEGHIPAELGNLVNLEYLWLYSNFLTGSIPEEFGQLKNLGSLNLSCNKLKDSIPAELGQLQNLKEIDLSFNEYQGEIPREIASLYSLTNLTMLNITNNRYSGLIPTSLINHSRWDEIVWEIVKQQPGFKFEREIVKVNNSIVNDYHGNSISLDSLFTANKLTVVFKWAYWCPNSEQFLPIIKAVYDNYHSHGLEVIAFTRTNMNDEEFIRDYIKANNLTWSNVVLTENMDRFANFPNLTVPNVHIIDSKGEIIFSDQLWDKREDFESFIESRLGSINLYQSIDHIHDGEVTVLQNAAIGRGINLVLMGDGFVDTTMAAGGIYESRMKEGMEHFFAVEPIRSYPDYFNVYSVKAVSKNGVFMDRSETAFDSKFIENRGIQGDHERIKEYAKKIDGISSGETHIIVIMNSPGNAGMCYMYDDGSISFISIPSDPNSFAGLIQHEAIGHGLGRLGDEYIDHYDTIAQGQEDQLLAMQSKGWFLNLSLSPGDTPWQHFIGESGYEMVGAYQGGYYVWKGVWRPEENSTMKVSNLHYFNAPSREQIVRRLLLAAGFNFSWDDFLIKDRTQSSKKTTIIHFSDPLKERETHYIPILMNKKLF